MTNVLEIQTIDASRVWTVSRPHVRNAIDEHVVHALEAALDDVERDPALRAVVITGSGEASFISGADLKRLGALSELERDALDARMRAAMHRLAALPVPVFAALNGAVMGGGCEVALACDVRIAEPHVRIAFRHAAMGVTPGWGGLTRLTSLVGRSTAARLLFTALPVDADEALRVGLVDELVEQGRSLARALELARAVAEASPSAVADAKRLLSLAYDEPFEITRDEEQRTFLARARSADHAEALAAVREKRAAQFAPRRID